MPFGKYVGYRLYDIPTGYLQWASRLDLDGDLAFAISCELRARSYAPPTPKPAVGFTLTIAPEHRLVITEIIELGYRAAAKKAHPDVGGEHEVMQKLNAVVSTLRQQLARIA